MLKKRVNAMNKLRYSKDYIVAASQKTKERDYWLNKLSGELVKSSFPFDYKRSGNERKMEVIDYQFPESTFSEFMRLSNGSYPKMHIILVTALMVLLQKYTGSKDIVVGSPIYKQKIESDLINVVLVLRNQIRVDLTFKELLLEVKQTIAEAVENRNYPIEILSDQLKKPILPDSDFPLFDTAVLVQNIHDKKYLMHINHNMTFSFLITDLSVEGMVEYNACLYEKTTIERILSHFTRLLNEAAGKMDILTADIDILSDSEKKQLLFDFNDTKTRYPGDKTIHELFEKQVKITPGKIAVSCEDKQLTYEELNEKANKLARVLKRKGVKADTIVGIMVDRSLEMVFGILAILKAEGAYLPIDSEYPGERIRYTLADSCAGILLTTQNLSRGGEKLKKWKGETIFLEAHPQSKPEHPEVPLNLGPQSLAYIIYTSGTTGKPNGVMVEHSNVVRLVKNTNYIEFGEGDKILQTGALEFDASTFEIWGALLNGLELHLVNNEIIFSTEKLKETIQKNGVSTMWMTSPLFNQLLEGDIGIFRGLKYLLVGGDVLSPTHINRLRKEFPGLYIINGYGPTENTTFSTTYLINDHDPDKENHEKFPIGKPISNSTAYIVDESYKILPIGAPGELIAGGDGVSRGYLNNPELTAERFIHSTEQASVFPVSPEDKCLYRTGDRARWLPDGNIEFQGRIDQQVKIRGYRIELSEIERQLLRSEKVKEAVVIVRDESAENAYAQKTGGKCLCAYLVSDEEINVSELKKFLSKELPDYLIPSYFISMDKLPLTSNGKLDRRALPDPKTTISTGSPYEAPENEMEDKIVQIWGEILGIDPENIGVTDDFFLLGGNSIGVLKMINHINVVFDLSITISDIFLHPTVRELAKEIYRETLFRRLECVVKLNKGNRDKNIFIIHQGGGMVYPYKKFAELLEKDYNVYGIQPKGLFREGKLPKNHKELLMDYIMEIKMVQKKGPYIIAGYCVGVTLAYELVSILEILDEQVKRLIIFDETPFISDFYLSFLHIKDFVHSRLVKNFPLFPLRKKMKKLKLSDDESILKSDKESKEIKKGFDQRKDEVIKNLIKIVRKIKPRRIIDTPILVIKARETIFPRLTKRFWSKMTKGEIQFIEVPGNHNSIFRIPFVNKVAKIIKKMI